MKRKLAVIAIILIFLTGLGMMSYPLISSMINNHALAGKVNVYNDIVSDIKPDKYKALLKKANRYNHGLSNNAVITDPFDRDSYEKIGAGYKETLDVDGEGLIGFVEIPKISVNLPIYHGTSDQVLDKGAGHLQNTSMPVGGKSTHSIIAAHTGLPNATMFDYLTELKEEDVFYIKVIGKTLKYKVDQIRVVLPDNLSDMHIIDGEDYVTLLTCTPYGVNTHRLLVRGKRVTMGKKEVHEPVKQTQFQDGYMYVYGYRFPYWECGLLIGGFVLAVAIVIIFAIRRKRLDRSSDEV